MTTLLFIALGLAVLLLWRPGFNFRAQRPADYQDLGPAFDIQTHLAGDMISEGIIYGPTGRVATRFVAEMQGDWSGNTGTLAEQFSYAGAGTQSRKWYLKMGENGAFTATADDLVGEGIGQQSGATVRMTYKIRLTPEAGGHVLSVTDWMYLMENGTIMNKSVMRKFGLPVAELVATIRPLEPSNGTNAPSL